MISNTMMSPVWIGCSSIHRNSRSPRLNAGSIDSLRRGQCSCSLSLSLSRSLRARRAPEHDDDRIERAREQGVAAVHGQRHRNHQGKIQQLLHCVPPSSGKQQVPTSQRIDGDDGGVSHGATSERRRWKAASGLRHRRLRHDEMHCRRGTGFEAETDAAATRHRGASPRTEPDGATCRSLPALPAPGCSAARIACTVCLSAGVHHGAICIHATIAIGPR